MISPEAVAGLHRAFVIRHEGFPPDSSTDFEFEPSAITTSQNPGPYQKGRSLLDHEIVVAHLRPDLRSVTLRAGLAAGPWQSLVKREPQAGTSGNFQHEGRDWTVLFQDPIESGAQTQLTASHSAARGWETRIVAMDLEGRQHLAPRSYQSSSSVALTTARFDKLPLAQIKEFQFQVRPYRWAEFRNVSLQAGHRTNVEVRDAVVTTNAHVRSFPSGGTLMGMCEAPVTALLDIYAISSGLGLIVASPVKQMGSRVIVLPERHGQDWGGVKFLPVIGKALLDQRGIMMTRLDDKRVSVTYNHALKATPIRDEFTLSTLKIPLTRP